MVDIVYTFEVIFMDERVRVLIFSFIREIFLTIPRRSVEIKIAAIRIFVFYAQPFFFFFFFFFFTREFVFPPTFDVKKFQLAVYHRI